MKPKVFVRKARTFGEVFGDTIGYIKQNFGSLFGSILLIVSPFVLICGVINVFLMRSAFANIALRPTDPFAMYTNNIGLIILLFFLYILSYTAFVTIINEHMNINDGLPNHEKPQVKDLVKNFFKPYLRGLGSMFLMMVLSIVLVVVIGLIFAMLGFFISLTPIVGILLFIVAYLFFLVVVMPMVLYWFSGILFTAQRHRISVFEAIGKVRKNVKGNFWSTWSVSFLGGLIVGILSFIAFLPSYILLIITMFSRMGHLQDTTNAESGFDVPIYLVVVMCISGLVMLCIYAIYFVMMNLQCASLEEKSEGVSILEKIDSI